MHALERDLRYALRSLRRNPSFTLLAALTLGLGIGAATTIYSVIQNVLFDPYPYAHTDRNVSLLIHDTSRPRSGGRGFFKLDEFLDYQEQIQSFEEVIAGGFEDVLYSTDEGTEQLTGALMSGNNFSFLGIPAALGRTITPEDGLPGAAPVFVLSHRAWANRFGSDPKIVGKSFVLNGVPTTLVGVMPPRFHKMAAEVYKPVRLERGDPEHRERFFRLQARLKPGVTREQAEAEANVVAQRVSKLHPDDYPKTFRAEVATWADSIVGPFKNTLYTLAAAVALLLLIACGNVANMLLSRATAREREMAVRASLGATRARLVRQLLVESLLLALVGAAVGWGFAYAGLPALVRAIPEGLIPREAVIRLNLPVLLFSLGVAVLTSVVCGLVPALRLAGNLVDPLKDSGKGGGGAGYRGRQLNGALVTAEVALSLVLLAGAGLLMRSFVELQTQDLGIRPERVLNARVPLPRGSYQAPAAKQQYFDQVLNRVRALPGVVSASVASSVPPFGGIRTEVDYPGRATSERQDAIVQLCTEGYFETLGYTLRRGRVLTAVDVAGARQVAVVNETLGRRFFGTDDPVGRTVELKTLATVREAPLASPVFEIVGIVADARNQGPQEEIAPEAFIPHSVTSAFDRGILVRTEGAPAAITNDVRRAIWSVDRSVAVTTVVGLGELLAQFAYAEPRLVLVILGVFALLGLVLVALGVFSVTAYAVSRQTHEIGIRMALGAGRGDVLRHVLHGAFRRVGLGVAVGLLASLAATRVLAHQLFAVSPYDPATLSAVVALVLVVGFLACYLPARRAARVEPTVALRYE
jgi:putative ABC transport system permease protein